MKTRMDDVASTANETTSSAELTVEVSRLSSFSIVLVIIGLIVGGVLVGQDLIQAAAVRATISQIEKFNTAAHAFQLKYSCLPGDCATAGNFGFVARGSAAGEGDGNGQRNSEAQEAGAIYKWESPQFSGGT